MSRGSGEPVEDKLVDEFRRTVEESTNRLRWTWRALSITGLLSGLGLMALSASRGQ